MVVDWRCIRELSLTTIKARLPCANRNGHLRACARAELRSRAPARAALARLQCAIIHALARACTHGDSRAATVGTSVGARARTHAPAYTPLARTHAQVVEIVMRGQRMAKCASEDVVPGRRTVPPLRAACSVHRTTCRRGSPHVSLALCGQSCLVRAQPSAPARPHPWNTPLHLARACAHTPPHARPSAPVRARLPRPPPRTCT